MMFLQPQQVFWSFVSHYGESCMSNFWPFESSYVISSLHASPLNHKWPRNSHLKKQMWLARVSKNGSEYQLLIHGKFESYKSVHKIWLYEFSLQRRGRVSKPNEHSK